jgi:uncharacterized membrane protein
MKRFLRSTRKRAAIIGELFHFLWVARLWWMIPIIVTLLLFGVLVLIAQSSAIAPFIYTLF